MPKTNCTECGKKVYKKPIELKKNKNHFCSHGCRNIWQSKHKIGKNHHLYSKVEIKCDQCGNIFLRNPYQIKKVKHHFCNRRCMGNWKKNIIGEEIHNWKGGPQKIKCSHCKKIFKKKKDQIIRSHNHFCSPDCKKKWQKGRSRGSFSEDHKKKISDALKGDKHYNWMGGTSFEPYTIDFNNRFKEAIRERDNRACVVCNLAEEKLNYNLHVHHIDYNKKNSFPQNCVSLCRDCHLVTNFNRESWKAFFQSLFTKRYNYEYSEDQKIILDFNEVK